MHEVAHARLQPLRVRDLRQPPQNNYCWLEQAAAEWAAFRVEDFLTPTQDTSRRSRATVGRLRRRRVRDTDGYDDTAGDSGWTFIEYLSERFGPDIVKDVFTARRRRSDVPHSRRRTYVSDVARRQGHDVRETSSPTTPLASTDRELLGPRRSRACCRRRRSARSSAPSPARSRPPTSPSATSRRATLAFTHGDVAGNDTGTCYAASLALTVALPAGDQRQAVLLREHDSARRRRRSRSPAAPRRSRCPWNTCTGSADGVPLAAQPEHRPRRERQGVHDQRHADRRPEHADGRDAAARPPSTPARRSQLRRPTSPRRSTSTGPRSCASRRSTAWCG